MNNEYITITADGVDHKCRIIFTFSSEEFNHSYVVFSVEDTEELSAMIYVENDTTSGTLEPITNDDEWDLVEQVVSDYFENKEHGCGCGCGDHDCGCGDHDCGCGEHECCCGDECDSDCDHDHN